MLEIKEKEFTAEGAEFVHQGTDIEHDAVVAERQRMGTKLVTVKTDATSRHFIGLLLHLVDQDAVNRCYDNAT